ncbi:uncharacterized protein PRCAT00002806001 [Priceomyces carsonii]|uniref:uncharacterized protein n=1 Tax=Priceomyces carsonii TaxID=28549 RepID=UPI002EDB0F06|nr:unnamed protein product [Priceomyces carsonii]
MSSQASHKHIFMPHKDVQTTPVCILCFLFRNFCCLILGVEIVARRLYNSLCVPPDGTDRRRIYVKFTIIEHTSASRLLPNATSEKLKPSDRMWLLFWPLKNGNYPKRIVRRIRKINISEQNI